MYELNEEQEKYLKSQGFKEKEDKKGLYVRDNSMRKVVEYIDLRRGRIETYGYKYDNKGSTTGALKVTKNLKFMVSGQERLDTFGFTSAGSINA